MLDILLNDTGDLKFQNNDVVMGESTEQHQRLLLLAHKGDYKESPTVGVNATLFLKDEDNGGLLASIKSEFEKDGMKVNNIAITGEKLTIDARYKN